MNGSERKLYYTIIFIFGFITISFLAPFFPFEVGTVQKLIGSFIFTAIAGFVMK